MSRHSQQSAVPTTNLNIVRRHYRDLDGFRAIAALAIVCMHVQVRGGYVHANQWLVDLVSPWGIFITLFFINMLGLAHLFASDTTSYLFTLAFVIVGTFLFATAAHKGITKMTAWIADRSTMWGNAADNESNKEPTQ